MAEALGSLCDKLTIVKLKEWHSENQPERMRSLATQEQQLLGGDRCICRGCRQRSYSSGAADFCCQQDL